MKTRLFDRKNNQKKTQSTEVINPLTFNCLNGSDVITAHVSDHHPVIHDDTLLWNIMKQANKRHNRYNNGFGIIENEASYSKRLMRIAKVVAEIVFRYPTIDVITFCEGPIQPADVRTLIHALKNYPAMNKFFNHEPKEDIFHQPDIKEFPNQGLLMLAAKEYRINKITCDAIEQLGLSAKLANRLQLWHLITNDRVKHIGLAHLPFAGDELITNEKALSSDGKKYCALINMLLQQYADKRLVFCADFNLNPYLISTWQERIADQITHNNSILFYQEEKTGMTHIQPVTVDGILLSRKEKQRYEDLRFNPGLFTRLKKEHDLFSASCKQHLHNIMR